MASNEGSSGEPGGPGSARVTEGNGGRPVERVGADVGGTFTDVVLVDGAGRVATRKVASSPDDFGRAIVQGVEALLGERDLPPGRLRDVVHGTTVATNAILEHRGAKTGLLTTRGFRDVLEMRRLRMPRLYELFWDKP